MSNFNVWSPLGDLDSVFALRGATDPSANPTGLYDPTGNDLCLRYQVYTSGTQAAPTRYNVIQPDGTYKDLNQIFAIPKGITWVAMGYGIANNQVKTIYALDNSNIYVGGEFLSVGGDTNKKYIVRWDGATWQRMGTGTNGVVNAISAVDNSNVYVGGDFTLASNIGASFIAKWDGSTWQRMGSDRFGSVSLGVTEIFTVDNSNVYAGGYFTNIGASSIIRITRWDGATWKNMASSNPGGFVNSPVLAISAVDNSNVYIGGQFTNIGGDTNKQYIARWNGATWRAMSSGATSNVRSLFAVDNSNVYFGGDFPNIGGDINKRYIAKWDGSTWQRMGIGTSNFVYAISAVDNSNVYVGGNFTTAGGRGASYIARWDGATWNALSTGTNGVVNAISAVDNSNVYVGGAFTNIGGDTNKVRIVKWTNNY